MPNRNTRKASEHLEAAIAMEREKDYPGAIAHYQKAVKADPSNPHGWNRLMIAYRKTKTQLQEAELIKEAIASYQTAIKTTQTQWIEENKEKVESSRELAKIMGLLDSKGLPQTDDQTIEKWQTRLYLLEYRIRAKKKKADSAKTKAKANTKKVVQPKPVKDKISPGRPDKTKKK